MTSSANIPHIYSPRAEHVAASDWNALQNREFGVSTKDADYTLTTADKYITINGSSNTVEMLLPASPVSWQYYDFACIDSTFACTINPNGKAIFDSTDIEPIYSGENLSLRYDGNRWVTA
jgi:hypothetical protein